MNSEREQAWEAEDRTEGVDIPGTRKDIGVGSEDRQPGFGPTSAAGGGAAGSRSEAAEDTSVELDGPTERTETRRPPD